MKGGLSKCTCITEKKNKCTSSVASTEKLEK